MSKKKDNFIKLDRQLIRVLGLNNAVVFCHLKGIQESINSKNNKYDIYQQINVLEYETGLTKQTIIKTIKKLNDLKLLHKRKHGERNKNYYLVDKNNYYKLKDFIDKLENNKIKKSGLNAKQLKKEVLNLYQEYIKNNTISSDNFNTTDKDLIKRDLKRRENKSNRQFLENCTHKPITIDYSINDVFIDSETYYFIPLFFKDEYTDDDIFNFLIANKNGGLDEHKSLEYFLQEYFNYYGKLHRQDKPPKIREILQKIHNINIKLDNLDYDKGYIMDIIDEYFKTPNKLDRDLTIYLFLSDNWIPTLLNRLI